MTFLHLSVPRALLQGNNIIFHYFYLNKFNENRKPFTLYRGERGHSNYITVLAKYSQTFYKISMKFNEITIRPRPTNYT